MSNKENFINEWSHFCKTINFGASALDADAVRFMNEFPLKLDQVIKEECKYEFGSLDDMADRFFEIAKKSGHPLKQMHLELVDVWGNRQKLGKRDEEDVKIN